MAETYTLRLNRSVLGLHGRDVHTETKPLSFKTRPGSPTTETEIRHWGSRLLWCFENSPTHTCEIWQEFSFFFFLFFLSSFRTKHEDYCWIFRLILVGADWLKCHFVSNLFKSMFQSMFLCGFFRHGIWGCSICWRSRFRFDMSHLSWRARRSKTGW